MSKHLTDPIILQEEAEGAERGISTTPSGVWAIALNYILAADHADDADDGGSIRKYPRDPRESIAVSQSE